jgi:hypothetical protein
VWQQLSSAVFAQFPWTVIHTIDEKSPLYNMTPEDLVAQRCRLVVLLSGMKDNRAVSRAVVSKSNDALMSCRRGCDVQ